MVHVVLLLLAFTESVVLHQVGKKTRVHCDLLPQHLDLNNDKSVSKSELEVFLKHLFKEQLKATNEKLKTKV